MILLTTLTASASKSQNLKKIKFTTNNVVYINGPIDANSMVQAKKALFTQTFKRGSSPYKIYIVLNSPGGSISAGESFIRYAKSFKNIETVTIFAASMAHAIVQALPGKRYAVEDAILMAHRAKVSLSGQINDGELESRLRMIKAMVTSMEIRNANRIGVSLLTYKSKVVNEWWTYGEESVKQNIVDQLVLTSCTPELAKKEITIYKRSFFGTTKIKSSACPLL